MPDPSIHADVNAPDAQLAAEAADYFGARPALQVVAELLQGLRTLRLPWWTSDLRRVAHPAEERMRQLGARPDVRQRIMMALTHMPPRASRRLSPEMQGSLIDEVLHEDVTVEAFEDAFLPVETVTYGDAAGLVREVVAALPWGDDSPAHRKVLEIFMDACLKERSHAGKALPPLLSWLDLRLAIDADAWQEHLPRAVRVKVDKARLEAERAGAAFTARHELETVGLATVRDNLPLKSLAGIFTAAIARLPGGGGGDDESPAKKPEQARPAPLKIAVQAPPPVPNPTAARVDEVRQDNLPTLIEAEAAEAEADLAEGTLTDEGLESVPANLLPVGGDDEEDAQYLLVGGIPNEEINFDPDAPVPDSENPWAGEDLTDPGVKAAAEKADGRRLNRTDPLRRRNRPGAN